MTRLNHLTSWNADWSELRVAVVGLSATGFAAADTLTELGSSVLVLGDDTQDEFAKLVPVIGAQLWQGTLDATPAALIEFDADVIIVSSEFAPNHPIVVWAREAGIALWSDVELAWRVRDKVVREDGTPAEWIMVTATAGAAETAELTALMLAEQGLRVAPCGNNGVPVLDAVRDPAGFDVFVVEMTGEQLWYLGLAEQAGQPVPLAAVCLNHAPDGSSWHSSAADYRAAHAVVYRNTKHACVYNKADIATREMVEDADVVDGARAVGFDLGVPGPSDLGVVEGLVVDRAFLAERHNSALELIEIDVLAGVGLGSAAAVTCVLAASALSRAAGASPESINAALRGFRLAS